MTKHLSIAAAATLAVSGLAWNAHAQQTPPTVPDNQNAVERAADKTGDALKNAADKTRDALSTAGDKTKDALGIGKSATASGEEINDLLAQVVEAAFTKAGLDDMAERFVDADRNRLGQNQDALTNNADLDGLVDQLQKDWKSKYGAEFDIGDEDKVYGSFALISEGEITGAARTAGEKVDADATHTGSHTSATGNASGPNGGGVSGARSVNTNTGVDAPKPNTGGQTAADRNTNDPGRNIASVQIAASHGMPAVTVPLIHEAGGWKIDIPDTVDSTKLRDNVKSALTECNENKDKWPADATEAYRAVTHKVLLSIFDKPLMDDAQKASDTQPPTHTGTSALPQ